MACIVVEELAAHYEIDLLLQIVHRLIDICFLTANLRKIESKTK